MTLIETYTPTSLCELISWPHFLHAWGMKGSVAASSEARKLLDEAVCALSHLESRGLLVRAKAMVVDAVSRGDDIWVETEFGAVCIPCLRQQVVGSEGDVCRCLSDYVAPQRCAHPVGNRIGIFATSVDVSAFLSGADDYQSMLFQTLADRLAEAAAEQIHTAIYNKEWASCEAAPRVGIRPAVGYPCLPDMSLNFEFDKLLHFADLGISLTSSGMMVPHASVSGLIFAHPQATYFSVGAITDEQLSDYAARRCMSVEQMRRYVSGVMTSES